MDETGANYTEWSKPERKTPIQYEVKWSEVKWSEVVQSCPTLCDPMDCGLPVSSIPGILQAGILEWVAISFSKRSSQPRDQTWVSHIAGRRFTIWATREVNANLWQNWNSFLCLRTPWSFFSITLTQYILLNPFHQKYLCEEQKTHHLLLFTCVWGRFSINY